MVIVAIAADSSSNSTLFAAAILDTVAMRPDNSSKFVLPSLTVVNIISATLLALSAPILKEFKTVVIPSTAVVVSVTPPIAAFAASSSTFRPCAPS